MSRLKALLGYSRAVLSIPIMLVGALAFTEQVPWGANLAASTGLAHSANWTGGEVVRTVEHSAYRTEIHRMVFDALIGEHAKGFVQVAWRPAEALPARIDEEIDADADGSADFRIELETATRSASLTPHSPMVLGLEGVYRLGETLAIRVTLDNPRR